MLILQNVINQAIPVLLILSFISSSLVSIQNLKVVYNHPDTCNAAELSYRNNTNAQNLIIVPTPPVTTRLISPENILFPINKEISIDRYYPPNLTNVPSSPGHSMREEVIGPLEEMLSAALDDGVKLSILSSFRSYETQDELFSNYLEQYGESAASFSARPGHSEHQLGTTLDFGCTCADDFTAKFDETAAGKWLIDYSYKYGFVMSYPQDMESTTGYIYEPWHYRFIGRSHALELRDTHLTLVEYLLTL